jgi:hypothetical protein
MHLLQLMEGHLNSAPYSINVGLDRTQTVSAFRPALVRTS